MPATTIKAVVSKSGAPGHLSFAQVAAPKVGHGQIEIEVAAFSLNRGDLRRAENATADGQPVGWDISGRVFSVASDISAFKPGQRVVAMCRPCHGWAERVAVDARDVAIIPDPVTFEQAASLPVAGLTALKALDIGGSLIGRRVLVTGATGGAGVFAVQLARLAGAHVTAQIRDTAADDFVRSLGAHETIVTEDGEAFAALAPFSLIVESIGGVLFKNAVLALGDDGQLVTFAGTADPIGPIDLYSLMQRPRAAIRGLWLYTETEAFGIGCELARLLDLTARGDLRPQINRSAGWRQTPIVAQELIDRKFRGKAVMTVDSPE